MAKQDLLGTTWHDSAWIPHLNLNNVMDYFCDLANPFYDRTCNNENIKMQRLGADQLSAMTGVEYVLLHAQDPILYVIRKQYRQSSTQVSPLADFYIVAGKIYQAPDLASVVNSRLMNTISCLETAFEEARSYSRYHPSKGYWWEFKDDASKDDRGEKEKAAQQKKRKKEEPSWWFQRQRVDLLLAELASKYPPKVTAAIPAAAPVATQPAAALAQHQHLQQASTAASSHSREDATKVEVKAESREADAPKASDKKPVTTRLR